MTIGPFAALCRDERCASRPDAIHGHNVWKEDRWVFDSHWHCTKCGAIYHGHAEHRC